MAPRLAKWNIARGVILGALAVGIPAVVVLAASEVSIQVSSDGLYRHVISNGIPDHATGTFPNANNPNRISAQNHEYRMPLNPQPAPTVTELELGPFGVAINGVPFDPGAAEFWNNDRSSGWRYEALSGAIDLGVDLANAHVQPNGAYHYHGIPDPLAAARGPDGHSMLIGWAADGFPVYATYGYADPKDPDSGVVALRSGHRIKQGNRPSGPGGAYDGSFVQDYEHVAGLGDLDACNGRFTVTPDFPSGTYAYFLTEEFPAIPLCLVGTPDASFSRGPGGLGGQGGAGGPGGPGGPDGPGGPGNPPPRR